MYLLKSLINKIKKKKKAVSPLIATIVLISFTIAIGSLVINWGKQFITAQTQGLQQAGVECQKENADIIKVIYDKTHSKLAFTIKNTGEIDIAFRKVNVYYKDGSVETITKIGDGDGGCGEEDNKDCTVEKGSVKQFENMELKNNNNKDGGESKEISYIEVPSAKCSDNFFYGYNIIEK